MFDSKQIHGDNSFCLKAIAGEAMLDQNLASDIRFLFVEKPP